MKHIRSVKGFKYDGMNYVAVARNKKLMIYSSDDFNIVQVRLFEKIVYMSRNYYLETTDSNSL